MNFTVVIPARYASARLPGKPLADICGKPMVQHTWERAQESGAARILIATDDARIADSAHGFGAEVCMTSAEHATGTDRLAEVAALEGFADDAILVNLQGDEPAMPPQLLRQVAEDMDAHPDASVTTLNQRIQHAAELFDPHVVKTVMDAQGYALYFSRAPVPWDRDAFAVTREDLRADAEHWRHLGVYAYRAGFLKRFATWPLSPLEGMESLEQLRVLWQGERIHCTAATESPGHGVDSPADLERMRAWFTKQGA